MKGRAGIVVGAVVVLAIGWLLFSPGPQGRSLPPPSNPSTTPTLGGASTTTVDPFTLALPAVGGETTLPPLEERGRARLDGVVLGPDGPLAGATVRIERIVGSQTQTIDVATGPAGGYELSGVPGGRYRVRAFQAPMFTVAEPVIFFLADGDERRVDLRADDVSGTTVSAGASPGAPIIGQGVNVAVRVAQVVVDADGIAREQPVANVPVRISSTGWVAIDPDTPRLTDGSGVAVFSFSCERVSSVAATAVVGPDGGDQELYTLDVPSCRPVPTTTTAAPTTTPDDPAATTTTTG